MTVGELDFPEAPPAFRLRPYQVDADNAVEAGWATVSRQLVIHATGTGKGSLAAHWAKKTAEQGKRMLFLAHRESLVRQTALRIAEQGGVEVEIEMGDEHASISAPIVCASVQSLSITGRLLGFSQDHFHLVIGDEIHRGLSATYQRVLNYFHFGECSLAEDWKMPEIGFPAKHYARVIGLTATPDVGAKKDLGLWFQIVAHEYNLLNAVRDGWLVRPIAQSMPLEIDLRGLQARRTPNGSDLSDSDVEERLYPVLEALAKMHAQMASERKSVAFLPSIKSARMFSEYASAAGLNASFVSGQCIDKNEKIEAFQVAGKGSVLANAALLCLDDKTEILTETGWVKCDQITMTHEIANWNFDGTVQFLKPIEIVSRPLQPSEFMVKIESKTFDFCVTNTHRMVVDCNSGWKKISAQELRSGHRLPSFGFAEPKARVVEQETRPAVKSSHVAGNAYAIRQREGMNSADSLAEARRRISVKHAMKYLQPGELSLDECRFIGFWIADGSVTELASCGLEYRLCQSTTYPNIVKWIDELLCSLGIHNLKKLKGPRGRTAAYYIWSIPRGTSGGSQKRSGVYHLEPYLKKNGTDLFRSLNEVQFDALIEGYWYGDGHHGDAANGFQGTVHFNDTKFGWVETIASIAPLRGWRTSMFVVKPAKSHYQPQYRLTMIKNRNLIISSKTKIVFDRDYRGRVWCVRTDSGNIFTRRNGKVTVMGNTEGWDVPTIDCVAMYRGTKSRVYYSQAAGRGSRALKGLLDGLETAEERLAAIQASPKKNFLILDPLWISDRLQLIQAYDLVTTRPEVAEIIKKSGATDLVAAEQEAERDFIASLEKEAKKHAKKKARTIDPLFWAVALSDASFTGYVPETSWDSLAPTKEQISFISSQGLETSGLVHRGLANKIIGKIVDRVKMNLCTPKQLKQLLLFGFSEEKAALMTKGAAGAIIGRKFAK